MSIVIILVTPQPAPESRAASLRRANGRLGSIRAAVLFRSLSLPGLRHLAVATESTEMLFPLTCPVMVAFPPANLSRSSLWPFSV